MDHQDQHVGQLLVEASPPAPTDPHRLVSAGITRGRALRRRQRAGTAAAAVAVLGVIGVGAVVVPSFGHGSGPGPTPIASDPTTSASPSPTSSPSPSVPPSTPPSDPPTSASGSVPPTSPQQGGELRITVPAVEVPATVARILDRQGAGPLRTEAPYGSVSQPDNLVAHFLWQGTLASVVIEPDAGSARQQCENAGPGSTCTTTASGDLQLLWGPTTADGVTTQGATVWRQGFRVSVLSYNAPDGKDVAPTMAAPPLSLEDLALLAGSDVWFG